MTMKKRYHSFPLLAAIAAILLSACNKKTEEEEVTYTPSTNVAVTAFSLKANSDVAPKLDSVFFAIDLREGVIFNADSLPVGTDISSLVPVITYPSTVGAASIETINGKYDYISSPETAHNFTGPVKLTLTAQDGTTQRTYNIKINVHKQNPAQLLWSKTSLSKLPATDSDPAEQKTFRYKESTYCYVADANGEITLSTMADGTSDWTSGTLTMPFSPDLRSATVGENSIYMLSTDGELYRSADGKSWTDCGVKWECITGAYLESVTGIRVESGKRKHSAWPTGSLPESEVSEQFPVAGFTNTGTVVTPWSPWPSIFLYGGRLENGKLSTSSWGFDGEKWTIISANEGPAIENAMLVPYWLSRPTSSMWLTDDRDAWLLMGGTLEDGTDNRKVWYSYDNGVNWFEGADTLALPEEMPGFSHADAVVYLQPRSASAEGWKQAPRRLPVTVEGTTILWECPEIYIYGGTLPSGKTANTIWRATLARFTFKPII